MQKNITILPFCKKYYNVTRPKKQEPNKVFRLVMQTNGVYNTRLFVTGKMIYRTKRGMIYCSFVAIKYDIRSFIREADIIPAGYIIHFGKKRMAPAKSTCVCKCFLLVPVAGVEPARVISPTDFEFSGRIGP